MLPNKFYMYVCMREKKVGTLTYYLWCVKWFHHFMYAQKKKNQNKTNGDNLKCCPVNTASTC